MAVSPFRIFVRKSKDGKQSFSARFLDEAGKVVKTQSLDAKTRPQAHREAETLLTKGIVLRDSVSAEDYLNAFWQIDSDYVKGRTLRGHSVSIRYVEENRRVLRLHAYEYLKGIRFQAISPATLETIILENAKRGKNPRTINRALQAITVPYAYFCKMNRRANPLPSIERLKENPRARGILSADEISRALAVDEDPRALAAFALGVYCGLRAGEIRALAWADVDEREGLLHVRHNFVRADEGLKAPKTGSARMVPLPGPAYQAMKLCRDTAPKGAAFILWNSRTACLPIPIATIEAGFRRIMKAIGIDETERKARNLVFHGLRHAFVSFSRAAGLPDYIVQRLAGHASAKMMENYSHADEHVVDFVAARHALENALKVSGS